MQTFGIILGIAAALLNIYGFWIYNKSVFYSKNNPNATTWLVWSVLSVINTWSYLKGTGDWVITLQFFTGLIGCIVTFVFCWVTGKFEKPDKTEQKILVACAISLMVLFSGNVTHANYITLFAFTISWWATIRKVWRDPNIETSLPWLIWSAVFWMQLNNAIQRFDDYWLALVNPAWLLVTNLTIALLASNWRKQRMESCKCPILRKTP